MLPTRGPEAPQTRFVGDKGIPPCLVLPGAPGAAPSGGALSTASTIGSMLFTIAWVTRGVLCDTKPFGFLFLGLLNAS